MKFLGLHRKHLSAATLLVWLVIVFTACTPLNPPPNHSGGLPRNGTLVSWVAGQEPGSRAVIDDPDFGGGVKVLVERLYYSASGRMCKRARITVNGPPTEPVAVCEGEENTWFLAPRIWGGAPLKGHGL